MSLDNNEYLTIYPLINELFGISTHIYDSTQGTFAEYANSLNFLFGPYYKKLNQEKDILVKDVFKAQDNNYIEPKESAYYFMGRHRILNINLAEDRLIREIMFPKLVLLVQDLLKPRARKIEDDYKQLTIDANFCWTYIHMYGNNSVGVKLLQKLNKKNYNWYSRTDINEQLDNRFKEIFHKYTAYHLMGII